MRAVRETEQLRGDALQVFPSSPRGWAMPAPNPKDDQELASICAERGWPIFVHAPYLVNIASPDPTTYARSAASLSATTERAARFGARCVVVHAGSSLGTDLGEALERAAEALLAALDAGERAAAACTAGEVGAGGTPDVLVELTAGGGPRSLARTVDQAAAILDVCDHDPRVGLCLDTCHLWAAGVDLTSTAGLRRLRSEVRSLGADRVRLLHANDSRDPLDSSRDRHANLGQGMIGVEAILRFLNLPEWRSVPIILETPGPDERRRADLALVRAATPRRRLRASRRPVATGAVPLLTVGKP